MDPQSEPQPLLSQVQLVHLCQQGWLSIPLASGWASKTEELHRHASLFFDQPPEVKKLIYPASGGTEKGFYQVPDEKEYITFRHHIYAGGEPDGAPDGVAPDGVKGPCTELEQKVSRFWQDAALLLYRVLCDLARALHLPILVWNSLVGSSLSLAKFADSSSNTTTLLRIFRYCPTSGFAAEHVDIGLLTLCIGEGKGLQVLARSSHAPPRWVDAKGPTILAGDTLRVLLSGRGPRSGTHRVVGNPNGRKSLVFALRPALNTAVDLESLGGTGTVESRDLWERIRSSKYNINATKDIRDEQKRAMESSTHSR